MIQGKWFPQGADLSDVLAVWQAVFSRGGDALDKEAQNVVVYLDGRPAAAGRIWWRGGGFWLGDIGVLEELRGRMLGDLVLRLLLFKAQEHYAAEVRLHAPVGVEGFFSRLGLREISRGAGLVEMIIYGNEIDLDTCRACGKQDCPKRKDPIG